MNIIDAHLHIFPEEEAYGSVKAKESGHENSPQYLRQEYKRLNIVHGVVMTNRTLRLDAHDYPTDLFSYCIGLDTHVMRGGLTTKKVELVEAHLQKDNCCGVKLYPGYTSVWLYDPRYVPIYELAQKYQKPVAVHMGLTAHPRAHLKYSHPLVLDEVAAEYRKTKFILCHLGNPFFADTAAVLAKNPNVYADVSGLLEGRVNVDWYLQEYHGVMDMIRNWLTYVGCWDRLLFGTDFPIVNYEEYIEFVCKLIPERHWEKVLFKNARYIYKLEDKI